MINLATQKIDGEHRPYHQRLILEHPFNSKITILVTGNAVDSAVLDNDLGSTLSLEACLTDLFTHPFLAFTQQNHKSMTMLSQSTAPLMVESAGFGIDNDGRLWIHLSRSLYRRFGLVGHPLNKSKDRFIIEVDLKNEKLNQEGSKLRERCLLCISNLFPKPITLKFSFATTELSNAFTANLPTLLPTASIPNIVTPKLTLTTLDNCFVPNFPGDLTLTKGGDTHQWIELNQWLGLVLNKCTQSLLGQRVDPFISTCTFDETSSSRQSIQVITIEDSHLIHSQVISDLFETLLRSRTEGLVALNVIGESNGPVTWEDYPTRSDEIGRTSHGYSVIIDTITSTAVNYQYSATNLNKHA